MKFTDNYGDTIEIETIDSIDDDKVSINVVEDGEMACVIFNADKAEEIAKDILTTICKDVVDLASIPEAGAVSFNEAVLRVAAIHKRTVEFRYAKDEGDYIEQRRVNPQAVATTKEGKTVVRGHDPDREASRVYRLDRIKGEVHFA